MYMKCRICFTEMKFQETVQGCRADYFGIKDRSFKMLTKDVDMYKCPQCTHIQIGYLISENYYDQYNAESGSEQYYGSLNLSSVKLEKLKNYIREEGKYRLFEIGCGSGRNLELSKLYFDSCLGIEPASNLYNIAKNKGLNVINAYFNQELRISERFLSFTSFQVFEHLESVYEVLSYAYEILEPGGVGLINVPNGQAICDNRYYHQVVAEHLNYFTPFSLASMANNAGFDVIEIESIEETLELDLYIRKPREQMCSFNDMKNQHKENLKSLTLNSNYITIWGAGAKAYSYSELLSEDLDIKHLIDSSVSKKGKYISGIKVPIENITRDIISMSDTIIIFASSYNEEIIQSLNNTYSFKGKIIYFDKEKIKYEIIE